MNYLANRVANLQPSATKAMTERAHALKLEGKSIISLSQGQPDFDTPPNITKAAIEAVNAGKTRYTPTSGIIELREAIKNKFLSDNQIEYSTSEIIVGTGAKQILFNAFLATLNFADEVIIPTPAWVSYPEMVKLIGGNPIEVYCDRQANYKLTAQQLEHAITPKTRWLVLNSPSNPTGSVYSKAELSALAECIRKYPRIMVLCDDIYEKLIYDNQAFYTLAQIAPDLKDRILTINGVSKAYAMTGWRIGYGAGPKALIKTMSIIQGHSTSNPNSIAQYATLAALTGPQHYLQQFTMAFEKRRNFMFGKLNSLDELDCTLPQGAFYLFVNCEGIFQKTTPQGKKLNNDIDVAFYLLEEFGVGLVPGSAFMAPGHLRLSFAAAESQLEAACERIKLALALLQ
ncbi:pyridoxal phosphate-dependent aminotransferase [Aliikangiella maris]|uniref:Pyridoxal phosphate-dependent aminotransferase n=2 Tax=Aliikangiella maris TaxID=3162458 RepID=A0ABV3MQJ3_9GAMM